MKIRLPAGWPRLLVKLCALLLFLLLSLSGTLPLWLDSLLKGSSDGFSEPAQYMPGWFKGILPALSPFAVFGSVLSQRALVIGGAMALAGIALLVALWRGRLFCAWLCPLGTVAEFEARVFKKGLLKKQFPTLNGMIFWASVLGACLGLPIFLAFDPLSSFNRAPLLLHWPIALAALIPMAFILFVLLLGVLKPMLWCSRICPLGFLLGFARRLRQQALLLIKGKAPERDFVLESRRDLIKGVCLGLPLTVASEGILASELVDSGAPVLPPGAGNAVNFHAACTRCYACVAACPSKVLTVGLPDSLNVPAWFAPHLKPGKVACSETCNRCSQVCSPGAIKFTPLPEKRKLQIGLAQVDRKTCVAWSEGQVCMACDEYCPYHAIDSDTSADGVSRPVVNPDKCRGCGYCMISCPVAKPGPAISVKGVLNQRTLKG